MVVVFAVVLVVVAAVAVVVAAAGVVVVAAVAAVIVLLLLSLLLLALLLLWLLAASPHVPSWAMEAILALGLPGPQAEAASDDEEEERFFDLAACNGNGASVADAGGESQGLAEEVAPVADGRLEDASSSNNANYECAF